MALDTYTGLKAEVADWLARQDLTARIPTFIRLAEARMSRELRCRQQETRATATLSSQFLALPTDFKSMKQLQLNATPTAPLTFVAAQELDVERRRQLDATGQPTIYSIVGSEIEVAPVPDANYEIEMVYFAKIPPLSDSEQTNWVLDDHPDLYLFASLVSAEAFLQNDDRLPVWASMVEKFLEDIRLDDERGRAGSSPLRRRIKPYGC